MSRNNIPVPRFLPAPRVLVEDREGNTLYYCSSIEDACNKCSTTRKLILHSLETGKATPRGHIFRHLMGPAPKSRAGRPRKSRTSRIPVIGPKRKRGRKPKVQKEHSGRKTPRRQVQKKFEVEENPEEQDEGAPLAIIVGQDSYSSSLYYIPPLWYNTESPKSPLSDLSTSFDDVLDAFDIIDSLYCPQSHQNPQSPPFIFNDCDEP